MNDKYLKLDWLGFTFHVDPNLNRSPIEQFLLAFPEFDSSLLTIPSFRTCYTNTLLYCDIVVSYNVIDEDLDSIERDRLLSMGVNVQVASHCLDMFCDMFGIDYKSVYAFRDIVTLLTDRNCKFSRIDLCYDDYDKIFNASYYCMKYEAGLIQTPCRKVFRAGRSDLDGATIYFGSLSKRNKLLRIYDKWKESGGEIDAVRYEFEYHNEMANGLINTLFEYDGSLPFLEMLCGVCKVKDPDSVANCARIQDAKIDQSWIDALKQDLTLYSPYPIKISPPKKDKLTSLNHFIEVQALSSIAGYVQCFGRESLYMLIRDAIKHGKISPRYMSFYNKLKYCNELRDTSNPMLDENPFF